VTTPDFEIRVSLVARDLVNHVPPDAKTYTEGEDVRLARDHVRSGLPAEIQAGAHSTDVLVEKRLVGFKDAGPAEGEEASRKDPSGARRSGVRSVRAGKKTQN
jgi:hypothetical protein